MTRPEQLQELLHTNQYFKMICGAGNEDTEEVRRLTMIYTLAGAKGFDISATPEVVKAAMNGIDRAYDISSDNGDRIHRYELRCGRQLNPGGAYIFSA